MALVGAAIGTMFLAHGDRGARAYTPFGIDPLAVLDVQVKNNVLIIFDSSGSMSWPLDRDWAGIGGDDPMSRMYQAKVAVDSVVRTNRAVVNFGLAEYDIDSSSKPIDGGTPLFYVSADPHAEIFFDFFNNMPGWYYSNGTSSQEVFRSFRNDQGIYDEGYPAGCTVPPDGPAPGTGSTGPNLCRYYLQSRLLRSGKRYLWDRTQWNENFKLVSTTAITCPNPPVGLTGFNPDNDADGRGDEARPCIVMRDNATGNDAYFYYTSASFPSQGVAGSPGCLGAGQITPVAPCNGDNSDIVLDALTAEVPPGNFSGGDFGLYPPENATDIRNQPLSGGLQTTPTGQVGIRSGQLTPLGGALQAVHQGTPAPWFAPDPTGGLQDNYVILLTDGDESCGGTPVTQARTLFDNAIPEQRAETFVVAFTSAVNAGTANAIARAGSGENADGTCDPGEACRDAFIATNLEELIAALNAAIQIGVSSGEFTASAGVIGTVFELAVPPADPLDPATRYKDRANLIFQSRFSLPRWEGEMGAFLNDGTATPVWTAGQALTDAVAATMAGNTYTFSGLHGGATVDSLGGAAIQRRIFTSAGNGSFPRTTDPEFDSASATGRNVVALWPPNQAGLNSGILDINPPIGTPGPLDDALGIGSGSVPVLTFGELAARYSTCESSVDNAGPAPVGCQTSDIDTARWEARQILLAWIAGAEVAIGTDGEPLRRDPPDLEAGMLLFEERDWQMGESTLSKAIVMTPPLRDAPSAHFREWILFRDGRRNVDREGIEELDLGFGQTNPDIDDQDADTKLALKPRKTVLFHGTNLVLYATSAESGEELWAYLPFDLLPTIDQVLRLGQSRDDHRYGVATSLRLADVFVPGPFTVSSSNGTVTTFDGRWRTFLYFGRGAGGKYLTALDVTAPGPHTRGAAATNPPWVAWNLGNRALDLTGTEIEPVFRRMGETWSVPAIGNVDLATNSLPEWRAWVGSGYSDDPDEGTTLFILDAVTGEVVSWSDVGDPDGTNITDNALVASPAAWNPFQLDPPGVLVRTNADYVTRVFIPDLHGRVWKFTGSSGNLFTEVPGADQPIADGPALLKLPFASASSPGGDFVYVGAGHDRRVAEPPSGFKIYGLKDTGGDSSTVEVTSPEFEDAYPVGYRNNSEPQTVFNAAGAGRVFFVGLRYNGPASGACLSTFDSYLFGLGAETGAYVYDFDGDGNADPGVEFLDTVALDISTEGNRGNILTGGGDTGPPASPTPTPTPTPGIQVVTTSQTSGSPVCRN
jgi:hypothetical protein